MRDQVLGSLRLDLATVTRLLEAVPDERLCVAFPGLPNHAAWTLGHLAHSLEAIGGELGLEPWLPEGWAETFGRGSRPVEDRSTYPSKDGLLAALEDGHARLRERLGSMSDADLAVELPDERFRELFPTLGHAVVHILCSHFARHIGQLDGWVRAAQRR